MRISNFAFVFALLFSAGAHADPFWITGFQSGEHCLIDYAKQNALNQVYFRCGNRQGRRTSEWNTDKRYFTRPCFPARPDFPGCIDFLEECTAGAYFVCPN